uniref:Uncharacterized protein n=1 Tax=Oryza glumipatula TaxID=40148 RepID=A0A0D9ZU24_9ORYZ
MGLQLHLWAEPKRGRPGKGLFKLGLQLHLWAEPKRDRQRTALGLELKRKERMNVRSKKQESIWFKIKGLGSGVGLVGVCLNYVSASKVILTDGDASTLENMKGNMEMNNLCVEQEGSQLPEENKNKVQCKYLSWEETSESDLWDCRPDLVLGADIIYDPVCAPHLIRVLSMLLRRGNNRGTNNVANKEETSNEFGSAATEVPVAYIATVIRNAETFNCFDKAAADAKLSVVNITNSEAPLSLLPYMLSYDRSSVQLLKITLLS